MTYFGTQDKRILFSLTTILTFKIDFDLKCALHGCPIRLPAVIGEVKVNEPRRAGGRDSDDGKLVARMAAGES